MKQNLLLGLFLFLLGSCQNSTLSTTSHQSSNQKQMRNKENVQTMLKAVNNQDIALLETLIHPDYIQHNPFIPSGRAPFFSLFPILKENNTEAVPQRIFQDGQYVVVHNLWKGATPFGASEMVAFDVLRIDESGLIAEHWDAMMANTAPNASGRSLIDGPTEVNDLDKTEAHKTAVRDLYSTLISGNEAAIGQALTQYFDPNYAQHNPDAADGIQGFFEAVQSGALQFKFERQHQVFGEGNFVLSISEGTHRGNPAVFYDLLRFESGKIVEHWDVIQDIPSEGLANENTMFGFN